MKAGDAFHAGFYFGFGLLACAFVIGTVAGLLILLLTLAATPRH